MEDESDLRHYIDVLMRHWILILVVTLLAGAVALAVSASFSIPVSSDGDRAGHPPAVSIPVLAGDPESSR